WSSFVRSLFTCGELTESPAGKVTTGRRGEVSPPVPLYLAAISWLVSQPCLLGTENFWSRALEAGPAAALAAVVSRTPEEPTVFLWASTQRVSDDTRFPPVEVVWCFYDVREDAIWTSRPAPSIRNDPYLALNSSLLCDVLTLGCVTSLRTAALRQHDRSFFCI